MVVNQIICQECVSIIDPEELLTCEPCKDTYHFHCAKLTQEEFSILNQNVQLFWKCTICLENPQTQVVAASPKPEKPQRPQFECFHCSKMFKKKTNLKAHLNIHLDARPFACNFCDKSFRMKHHLTRHQTNHAAEGPKAKKVDNFKVRASLKFFFQI